MGHSNIPAVHNPQNYVIKLLSVKITTRKQKMASELVDLNSSINIQKQQRKLPKSFFKHSVKGKHGDDTRKKDEEQPSQIKELYEHQNDIEQHTRKSIKKKKKKSDICRLQTD